MIGQTISHYNILEKLGEGGMGVVYKARDTKLDRLVALKFLPPHLNASEEDKARFIQEAKSAATLNHPNICTIHDIQDYEGSDSGDAPAGRQMFIVMELVDGQTLREKMHPAGAIHAGDPAKVGESPVPVKQAIDIGIQIADGLAAAHEKGIVHRDIKPENIMVRKDGIAQIMDFGLAKLRTRASSVNRLTKEGSTVGTAGYMSPEQVQGQDVDHRSDIFSFGVLMYELFTGQLPFKGVHETALMYEIVNVDPTPMVTVRPDLDPGLDAIVLECLEKDSNERAQSAKQIAIDLRRVKRESTRQRASRITAARQIVAPVPMESTQTTPSAPGSRIRVQVPWLIAALCFIGMIALAILLFRTPGSKGQMVWSSILPPDNLTFAAASATAGEGHLALSPDGTLLAFVAGDSMGRTHLMVRPLNSQSAKELPATEGAYYPFWSPDNRFIGFFQNGKMKKIEATGGPSMTLCDAADARGGSWNNSGVIVFAPSPIDALYKVSASGGTAEQLTRLDSSLHQRTHRWPAFLPDGEHFLYFGRSSFGGVEREEDGIFIGSLDGKETRRLVSGKANAFVVSGFLLYLRERTLMAQPFDAGKLEFTGDPVPVVEPVEYDLGYNRAVFSASDNGIIVYQPSKTQSGFQLEWFDRRGKSLGTIGDRAEYGAAMLSPDGRSVATDVYDPQSKNRDIWIYDLTRKIKTRFTFDGGVDEYPVWSPDGSRIVFHSDRRGHYDLYEKSTSGSGAEEILLESPVQKFPVAWFPDGMHFLYGAIDLKTGNDLWILPLGKDGRPGEQAPFPFLHSSFNEQTGSISPDMRWIAYESDESGSFELYVRPLYDQHGSLQKDGGGKWQVSSTGINANSNPRWSRDGKRLYYQSNDNKMISVAITSEGSSLNVGNSEHLFDIRSKGLILFQDMTADAQKFLFVNAVGSESTAPVGLITNWTAMAGKK